MPRQNTTVGLLRDARKATGDVRRSLEGEAIALNLQVARDLARRYARRGVPRDDLEQVAFLGLVKAVRRFDPCRDTDFLSFAVPTMRGELRRYFRDHGWTVRPPRSVQEQQARIGEAEAELSQELGRSPRPSEVAERLGVPLESVLDAFAAYGCFAPTSLDAPVRADEQQTLGERLGAEETGYAAAEARAALGPLLRSLDPRDRRILQLRFVRGLTQAEIGAEIGVTQAQVSRRLAQILRRLRAGLGAEAA